ncbi:hypothetical protein AB0J52_05845 [Spirillospora sp. NPDC049652]
MITWARPAAGDAVQWSRRAVGMGPRADVPFALLLVAGTALRALAIAGYRPVLWFNDAYDYVRIGLSPFAHPLRPQGYGLALWLLRPLHSLTTVVALQHVLVLVVAIAAYRLMTRALGVRGHWAALATAPLLLDPYQVQLEHMPMSDTLFFGLVFGAVTVLIRCDPSGGGLARTLGRTGAAGLLFGLATITRTVGLPLVVLGVLFLAVRYRTAWSWRVRLAVPAVLLAACAVPAGAVLLWFHAEHGRYAIGEADGVFFWGRTAAFADCEAHTPPPRLRRMCPTKPVGQRSASSTQIWEAGSPTGWRHGRPFGPETNELGRDFAIWAVRNQPGDYVRTVSYDVFVRSFAWSNPGYPHPWTVSFYRFPEQPHAPPHIDLIGGGTDESVSRAYEHGPAATKVVEPYGAVLRAYQEHVRTPGTVLGVAALLGAVGVFRRRNPAALPALLLWCTGMVLVVVPPATVDFDSRYLLPAAPFLCMAAVTAWRASPRKPEAPLDARDPAGMTDESAAPAIT